MEHVDVVVVGAGSIGDLSLCQLSQRSVLKVVGLDTYPRMNLNSSYAGESRLFRTIVKEGALFNEHVDVSLDLWLELQDLSSQSLLHQCGMLSIGPPDFDAIQATREIAEDYELPHEMLSPDELFSRYPQFRPDSHDIGILDIRGGVLRPEVAVAAAQLAAEDNGAQLHFRTRVTELTSRADGVKVATTDGSYLADHVVVATGSWTTRLLPELEPYVEARPIGSTWAMPHDVTQFYPDKFPGFIRDRIHEDGEESHWFGVPSLDGYSIKIGYYPEPSDKRVDVDPDTDLRKYSTDELSFIGEMLQKCIPHLLPSPVRHEMHHDTYASNQMPIFDRLEADDRVLYAAGLYGVGFKFTTSYGKMLTEMALDGESQLWREEFGLAAHDPLTRKRAPAQYTSCTDDGG